MATLTAVVEDLRAESDQLDSLVAPLPPQAWRGPTPAAGWTIAHQIAHLCWTDRVALTAIEDPDGFAAVVAEAMTDPTGFVDKAADELAATPPEELLALWREARTRLHAALPTVPEGQKIPWFGPPMSATSMATARLMETWAHGHDVADTLGLRRQPTARLRSIAHLGVRTRDYAYLVNGVPAPTEPIYVELTGPGGEVWTWGDPAAAQRVSGPALDFCEVVTRRRAVHHVDLVAVGPDATQWLSIAQAFAGPPGTGR